MSPQHVRLVMSLIIAALLLTGCDRNSAPASTSGSASRQPPAATPTYTEQDLENGLLPVAQLPGYAEVSGEPEPAANIEVTALMPLKGMQRRCQASAGGGLVDLGGLASAAQAAPSTSIHYGRPNASTMFSEQLVLLPAGTSPGLPRLRIPPGCERQDGTMEGINAYAVVKKLNKGQLPPISGAEVSGLQVDFHEKVANARMMSFRIIQVRAGSLMMRAITGTDGKIASATNEPVTKAWAHAEKQFA